MVDDKSTTKLLFLSGLEFNLGMVPGEGRLPAVKIKEHLVKRLEAFGLSHKKHTINSTLDGCNTNKSLGKLLEILIQFCLAHGIQLGICKTVYITEDDEFESINIEAEAIEQPEEPQVNHFYYILYIVKYIAKDDNFMTFI